MADVEMTSTQQQHPVVDDIEAGYKKEDLASSSTSPNLPPEPEIGKGFLKPVPETTPVERVAMAVGGITVILSVCAIVTSFSLLVMLAGISSILLGPYAYYQQTLLTDIRTLKETRRALQEEVDTLEASNQRLTTNIDTMTESVNRLEDVDEALKAITETQGQSVEAFKKQVADTKNVLAGMKQNHKATVLQNLLTVIFRSDKDKDNLISELETTDLIRSIDNSSEGITVHEDRFRQAVQGKPIQAVMDVLQNLLSDDTPSEERIFEIAQ